MCPITARWPCCRSGWRRSLRRDRPARSMQLGETLQILRAAQPDRRPIVPEYVQDAAITITLAIASIAFAPLLHGISPILAIAVLTLIAAAIVVAAPSYAPAIAIFVL